MFTYAETKKQNGNSISFDRTKDIKLNPVVQKFSNLQSGNTFQRKCACDGSHNGNGECEECKKKKLSLQRKEANSLQTKLTINTPGDAYEKEADAMAEKVMRMSIPENVNLKHNEDQRIQRKESSNNANLSTAPPIVNEVINSPSKPLDEETRGFMEPRFGYDFRNVRIHNDSLAHQSSADVNALAYTHAYHLVFANGQYQPQTTKGKKLLAHELTHVIQQRANNSMTIQKSPDDSGDKYKRTPPGKGAFTTADYEAWVRKHPKHTSYNGGPHEPDAFYKRYTPEWFWNNGYFYAISRYGGFKGAYFEIWLSNKEKGKEITVFRGDLAPSSGKASSPGSTTTPTLPTTPAKNPAILDPGGDFEKMFGEEIRSNEDTSILGKEGDATEYADGTIVFFDEDGQMTIYKPVVDTENESEYEVYDDDGEKTNEVVIGLEPENIFYIPDDSE